MSTFKRLLALLCALLLSTPLFVLMAFSLVEPVFLLAHGVRVDGEVVEKKVGEETEKVVRFQTRAGVVREVESTAERPITAQPGERVGVYYLPEEPEIARLDTVAALWEFVVVLGINSLLMPILAAAVLGLMMSSGPLAVFLASMYGVCVCCVLGVGVMLGGWTWSLIDSSFRTTGTVVEVRSTMVVQADRVQHVYIPIVRYVLLHGEEIVFPRRAARAPRYTPGTQVPVL